MNRNRYLVRNLIAVLVAIVAAASGTCSIADDASVSADQRALELGRKVLEVREAIQNPRGANAMKAVTSLGRDHRHYVMVRGWLSYQLEGDLSILEAAKGRTRDAVNQRINFLEKAIRAIDLE